MRLWKKNLGTLVTILAAGSQTMPRVVLRLGMTLVRTSVRPLVQLSGWPCLLTDLQIGFAPEPGKESNAVGTFPDAVRFP